MFFVLLSHFAFTCFREGDATRSWLTLIGRMVCRRWPTFSGNRRVMLFVFISNDRRSSFDSVDDHGAEVGARVSRRMMAPRMMSPSRLLCVSAIVGVFGVSATIAAGALS